MGREWKPGDVAVLTTPDGREFMAVRTEGGSTGDYWSAPKGWPRGSVSDYECAIRPLVVIDPEDTAEVGRLLTMYGVVGPEREPYLRRLQAALREFANPTPPKPDEPTGHLAVVEDEHGVRFVRNPRDVGDHERPWMSSSDPYDWREWPDVPAVRVLYHGEES